MNAVDDIERLHAAEKEAQAIVSQAKDAARRVRSETERKVAELSQGSGDALAAMRERVQSEEKGETEAFIKASKERVEAVSREIADKLAARKQDAINTVVEALVTL